MNREKINKTKSTLKDLKRDLNQVKKYNRLLTFLELHQSNLGSLPLFIYDNKETKEFQFFATLVGIIDYQISSFTSMKRDVYKLFKYRNEIVNYYIAYLSDNDKINNILMSYPSYVSFVEIYESILTQGSSHDLEFINAYNKGYLLSRTLDFDKVIDDYYIMFKDLKKSLDKNRTKILNHKVNNIVFK